MFPYKMVWYDPHIDGAGAGMISRDVIKDEEDPKAKELRHAEEEAAQAVFNLMIFGLCAAVITSGSGRRRRQKKSSKKR